LFLKAGIGRSTDRVPETVAGMAKHALAFLDGLGLDTCDVLGFSLVAWSHNKWRWIVNRLLERREDREPVSGPEVAQAQMMAFRDWEKFTGKRFADLAAIRQPALVVKGIHDAMIPIPNSYWLAENLPNAVLLAYPDSGHGSLFQFHESFTQQGRAFLASNSPFAHY
jgi:hypothetical protein